MKKLTELENELKEEIRLIKLCPKCNLEFDNGSYEEHQYCSKCKTICYNCISTAEAELIGIQEAKKILITQWIDWITYTLQYNLNKQTAELKLMEKREELKQSLSSDEKT